MSFLSASSQRTAIRKKTAALISTGRLIGIRINPTARRGGVAFRSSQTPVTVLTPHPCSWIDKVNRAVYSLFFLLPIGRPPATSSPTTRPRLQHARKQLMLRLCCFAYQCVASFNASTFVFLLFAFLFRFSLATPLPTFVPGTTEPFAAFACTAHSCCMLFVSAKTCRQHFVDSHGTISSALQPRPCCAKLKASGLTLKRVNSSHIEEVPTDPPQVTILPTLLDAVFTHDSTTSGVEGSPQVHVVANPSASDAAAFAFADNQLFTNLGWSSLREQLLLEQLQRTSKPSNSDCVWIRLVEDNLWTVVDDRIANSNHSMLSTIACLGKCALAQQSVFRSPPPAVKVHLTMLLTSLLHSFSITCRVNLDSYQFPEILQFMKQLFLQEKVALDQRSFIEIELCRLLSVEVHGRSLDKSPASVTLERYFSLTVFLSRMCALSCFTSLEEFQRFLTDDNSALRRLSLLHKTCKSMKKQHMKTATTPKISLLMGLDNASVVLPHNLGSVSVLFYTDLREKLLHTATDLFNTILFNATDATLPLKPSILPQLSFHAISPCSVANGSLPFRLPFLLRNCTNTTTAIVNGVATDIASDANFTDYVVRSAERSIVSFLVQTSSLTSEPPAGASNSSAALDATKVKSWLKLCESLQTVLLSLLHCCAVGPSRATEYLHLRFITLNDTEPATILFHSEYGMYTLLPNTKMLKLSAHSHMPRFYDECISDAFVTYVALVRPTQIALNVYIAKLKSTATDSNTGNSLLQLLHSHFLVSPSLLRCYSREMISAAITQTIQQAAGICFPFNVLRHLNHFFVSRFWPMILSSATQCFPEQLVCTAPEGFRFCTEVGRFVVSLYSSSVAVISQGHTEFTASREYAKDPQAEHSIAGGSQQRITSEQFRSVAVLWQKSILLPEARVPISKMFSGVRDKTFTVYKSLVPRAAPLLLQQITPELLTQQPLLLSFCSPWNGWRTPEQQQCAIELADLVAQSEKRKRDSSSTLSSVPLSSTAPLALIIRAFPGAGKTFSFFYPTIATLCSNGTISGICLIIEPLVVLINELTAPNSIFNSCPFLNHGSGMPPACVSWEFLKCNPHIRNSCLSYRPSSSPYFLVSTAERVVSDPDLLQFIQHLFAIHRISYVVIDEGQNALETYRVTWTSQLAAITSLCLKNSVPLCVATGSATLPQLPLIMDRLGWPIISKTRHAAPTFKVLAFPVGAQWQHKIIDLVVPQLDQSLCTICLNYLSQPRGSSPARVIVFFRFVPDIQRLADRLQQHSVPCRTYHSGNSDAENHESLRLWSDLQATPRLVLAASSKAGEGANFPFNVGLIIVYDCSYSNGSLLQWFNRARGPAICLLLSQSTSHNARSFVRHFAPAQCIQLQLQHYFDQALSEHFFTCKQRPGLLPHFWCSVCDPELRISTTERFSYTAQTMSTSTASQQHTPNVIEAEPSTLLNQYLSTGQLPLFSVESSKAPPASSSTIVQGSPLLPDESQNDLNFWNAAASAASQAEHHYHQRTSTKKRSNSHLGSPVTSSSGVTTPVSKVFAAPFAICATDLPAQYLPSQTLSSLSPTTLVSSHVHSPQFSASLSSSQSDSTATQTSTSRVSPTSSVSPNVSPFATALPPISWQSRLTTLCASVKMLNFCFICRSPLHLGENCTASHITAACFVCGQPNYKSTNHKCPQPKFPPNTCCYSCWMPPFHKDAARSNAPFDMSLPISSDVGKTHCPWFKALLRFGTQLRLPNYPTSAMFVAWLQSSTMEDRVTKAVAVLEQLLSS